MGTWVEVAAEPKAVMVGLVKEGSSPTSGSAAAARGWTVCWYDRERVFRDAAKALGLDDVDALLRAMGRPIGPPWQAKQKLAAAAALAAGRSNPTLRKGP